VVLFSFFTASKKISITLITGNLNYQCTSEIAVVPTFNGLGLALEHATVQACGFDKRVCGFCTVPC
jgi:hypothetical protein